MSGERAPALGAKARGNIGFVVGVAIGFQLREHQLPIDFDLKKPTPRRDEVDVVLLAEFLEDCLDHAHGTGGVVSGPAELNADGSHVR